jgi:nicotinamidase-related amidase
MDGKKPNRALLVVDAQTGLVAKDLHRKEAFLAAIADAIAAFRTSQDIVVFIRHEGAGLRRGTPEWEIFSGLDRRTEDPVVDKKHGNAFLRTGLSSILEEKGIRDVLACGLVSHGCVRATCLGGSALGLRTRLLKDGHSNWAKDAEKRIDAVERELASAGIEVGNAVSP